MDRSQLRTLAVDIYKEILGLNEDDMALLEEDRLDIRDDRYLNVNMWEEGDTLVEEDTSDDPGMLTTAVFHRKKKTSAIYLQCTPFSAGFF